MLLARIVSVTVCALIATVPLVVADDGVVLNPKKASVVLNGSESRFLEFRGGLRFDKNRTSEETRELGAIEVTDDGTMTVVSDLGYWLRAKLVHTDGKLVGLGKATVGPMFDAKGKEVQPVNDSVKKKDLRSDSEGLARLSDERFAVSFERRHRIACYSRDASGFRYPREHTLPFKSIKENVANSGIEALAALSGNRLLAIRENTKTKTGPIPAWITGCDGQQPRQVWYSRHGKLEPSGADLLPSGDLVVVERYWDNSAKKLEIGLFLIGKDQVSKALGGTAGEDVTLTGCEILRVENAAKRGFDNFEGIASRSGRLEGRPNETLIYLLSDANMRLSQETLLYMFALNTEAISSACK